LLRAGFEKALESNCLNKQTLFYLLEVVKNYLDRMS